MRSSFLNNNTFVIVLLQKLSILIYCGNGCTFHRQELCPEKRMLFYPKLPKIIGSDSLEDRIRSIHGAEGRKHASSCHVFGHTHFCWDAVLDGIRCVLC